MSHCCTIRCEGIKSSFLQHPVFEKHVFWANPSLAAIGQIQVTVATRDVVFRRKAEQPGSMIDPARATFNLDEVSYRGLIQEHLSGRGRVCIFSAELLVSEDRTVAHVGKDCLDRGAIWQVDFQLWPLLVFAGHRRAFIRENPSTGGDAYANEFAMLAQSALCVVEENI